MIPYDVAEKKHYEECAELLRPDDEQPATETDATNTKDEETALKDKETVLKDEETTLKDDETTRQG